MDNDKKIFHAQVPQLDLTEGAEMLTDFSREAQRHLMAARNALLILETVASDKEAIEDIFKTFHTIKGLADFLELRDIFSLTSTAEALLDKSRKGLAPFNHQMGQVVTQTIEGLQSLLELLDEQIRNGGVLKSEYLDVGDIIRAIEAIINRDAASANASKPSARSLPTINFEPDMTVCSQLQDKARDEAPEVMVETQMLRTLVEEFQETSRELKVAQSKLVERQRELIRERELAIKLTQQAQDEARAKSEYLANMSHEIRTLINAILGFTDLLKDGAMTNKQKEHLSTIILSGRMLLEIVNDILDFSKVESGKLKLEKIEFRLDHIIEDVFKIIRTRLLSKPINLYFHLDENVPVLLHGDPTRLKQIFINLIDNAIKFTEQGAIGLEVGVASDSDVDPDHTTLKFIVRDTGVGIPADRQQAVFDSFTQAHDSTTRIYGGSGLGLALCKTFVETMGGTIHIKSELGQGSQFIFEIPFPRARGGRVEPEVKERYPGVPVLIVDTHEVSVKSLLAVCQTVQLEVLAVCSSAKQAAEFLLEREKAGQSLPTIIFIDLLLPGKEGFMLAYKIKQQEHYRALKLVALSSDVKMETANEFVEAGFDWFLPKPIIPGEVQDVLAVVLGAKGAEQRMLSDDMIQQISCAGVRVLVAEDSIPNIELLRIHFEMLGCECDYANNGQEAVDFLRGKDYDICFMDLQMPVMGGIEASRVIRTELGKDLPIIALTAAELQDEKEKCLNVGMTDYLPKPFGLDELKEKIIRNTKM